MMDLCLWPRSSVDPREACTDGARVVVTSAFLVVTSAFLVVTRS